jgi:hypothetical protein
MAQFLRPVLASVLTLLVCLAPSFTPGQTPAKDTLKTVSYAELGHLVRTMKGKVVVVYFWSFG